MALAALATVALIATGAAAQDSYPSRPVRLLVGVAPGSTADVSLRLLAQKLSQILGGQFVVENRTGAGTSLAAQTVVQSPKDGYTLMYGGSANTVNATLSPNLGFDFAKDLDPVARIAAVPNMLVVHPSLGVEHRRRTDRARQIEARRNPLRLVRRRHLAASFRRTVQADGRRKPGARPLHRQFAGRERRHDRPGAGDVHAGLHRAAAGPRRRADCARQHARQADGGAAGACRPWRNPDLPGYETGVWNGLLAPAGTPRPIIDRLAQAAAEAVKSEDFIKALDANGILPFGAARRRNSDNSSATRSKNGARWWSPAGMQKQ